MPLLKSPSKNLDNHTEVSSNDQESPIEKIDADDDFDFGDVKTWHASDPLTAEDVFEIMQSLDAIDNGELSEEVTVTPERSDEVTKTVVAWSNEVTAEPPKSLSNKVTRRRRRSAVQDQQTIDQIQKYVPAPDDVNLLPLVGDFQTPISPLESPIETAPNTTPIASKKVSLPAWSHTKDWAKLVMANEALRVLEGSGLRRASWSLNLGSEREKEALSDAGGLGPHMGRYINRALQRACGEFPLYWFCIHKTLNGRFHLHGGMLVSDNDLDAVEKAMMHAGGKWAGKKDEHQFDINPDRGDTGWVRYAFGEQAAVKKQITGPAYVIGKSLRREAQQTYSIVREIMAGRSDLYAARL